MKVLTSSGQERL